jgi:5'-deoxynucleotidase YfbR-like HD superfamily hydrolase
MNRIEFHVWSGRILNIGALVPKDITLEDIAHGLSMICRWNGSCWIYYSVAEHCVRASDLVSTKAQKKRVLLHDAAEAIGIGDLIKPIKMYLPLYSEVEAKIVETIAKKYRLEKDFAHLPYVKLADSALTVAEIRDLLQKKNKEAREWFENASWRTKEATQLATKIPRIYPWIPREAKERFLERAHSLGLK